MADTNLAVVVNPEDRDEGSTVLLARATREGSLELLSEAWLRLLGYGRGRLEGKALGSLMAAERRLDSGEARVVAALFDRGSMASVDLTLRCPGGRRQALTLHRRLDAATGAIYIVGEATPGRVGRSACSKGVP
jgi:PAS domain-containing protein